MNNDLKHYGVSNNYAADRINGKWLNDFNKKLNYLNYEVLAEIYEHRKNHKLDEWKEFCKWIKELPYRKVFIGGEENDG